jgi:hypothetical protein
MGCSIPLRGKDDVGLTQVLGLDIARVKYFFVLKFSLFKVHVS